MKKTEARAVRVNWTREALPSGDYFATISKFEQDGPDWPDGAWTVVVRFDASPRDQGNPSVGYASFIVEDAPHERLQPGTRFSLYEGSAQVAEVTVVGDELSGQ